MDRIVVRSNWTNSVTEVWEYSLEDLRDPRTRQVLKHVMSDPEKLRPTKTRQKLTEDAAGEFAGLANKLRNRGEDAAAVAHFINRLVFCMFAEDADLLPTNMFTRMLTAAKRDPSQFESLCRALFGAMKSGGMVGFEAVSWFNGGLFDSDEVLDLDSDDIERCLQAAALPWDEIDPTIFGTLFVRGLDPDDRSSTGSEYTDREKIMLIVNPVIIQPLLREWEEVRSGIVSLTEPAQQTFDEELATASTFSELAEEVRSVAGRATDRPQGELFVELKKQKLVRSLDAVRSSLRAADKALVEARAEGFSRFSAFLARLRDIRVLDPACGSGNFLYLALVALKDIERQVAIEGELLGFPPSFPTIGPEALLGIELNPYAAELARVSVWIGEIQWMKRNGFDISRNPILKPLSTIDQRNAIIADDGSAALWPNADFIIGNPPYLGAKLLKRKLGVPTTEGIRKIYDGRLPGFTDLVCYWFENARAMVEAGTAKRVGFVATNSIRKNTNLPVMQRVAKTTRIFEAWSEEKWTVDGAAVDVSLICFGDNGTEPARLDGNVVATINADLTSDLNLTLARTLKQNSGTAMLGIQKSGCFDVPGQVARAWMAEPANPNGKTNAEVLKPYWNCDDVTGRPRDMWFIDLPLGLNKADAALYASPFAHLDTATDADGHTTEQQRAASGSKSATYPWWEPWRPRPAMRAKIQSMTRYIVTPETAEYRVFSWLAYPVLPDKNLIVIAREDDLMLGLLQSRFHEIWALRKGSDLQDRPRYTHTTTFGTFPFPEGMTPDVPVSTARMHPAAMEIERAAKRLDQARVGWLNPAGLTASQPEIVGGFGFPNRTAPVDAAAATTLAARTMTRLYNERPAWLVEAHRELDAAVAVAYGWSPEVSEEQALSLLLDLNLARS